MGGTFTSYSKAQALRSGGKPSVRQALLDVRARTLQLADDYAATLHDADMRVPYSAGLNPPLWELGHVAWFQESWIARNRQRGRGTLCDPGHARAPSLLPGADAWYDSSRVEHRLRWELALPDAAGSRGYLGATLARTLELLDALPADTSHQELYFFRLVALHEAMHAEAAVYMARALGVALREAALPEDVHPAPAQLTVPSQVFRLGCDGDAFAFDNELGAHDVALSRFEIDPAPVSWGRYLGFVEDNGYARRQWWSDEGWDWLRGQQPRGPEPARGVDAHSPAVHLSAYEAQAWCAWAGRRLPTEAEWECAALQAPGFGWGSVWEWTASTFQPYPGFTPHPYRDYSQPWFGERVVLRGACAATSPWLSHPRYRNFFQPHRTDIFAGFRSCA